MVINGLNDRAMLRHTAKKRTDRFFSERQDPRDGPTTFRDDKGLTSRCDTVKQRQALSLKAPCRN